MVLISLGGDQTIGKSRHQIAQLRELRRLNDNVRAIIDNERASADVPLPANRKRFQRVCDKLKIPLHILDRRATENYFTAAAIQEGLGIAHPPLAPFEKLSARWGKADNYRIARATNWADIENTDLGQFIEKL